MGFLSRYILDRRMEIIAPYVSGRVLDIGCGFADVYRKYYPVIQAYYGIEQTATHINKLKSKFPEGTFFVGNLEEDEFSFDKKFDVVLMIALIEHIFNQRHLMLQATRNLDANGIIVVTTPTPFGNDVVHRLGAKLGFFYQEAVDDHIVIYNKKRFQILAQRFDLEIIKYRQFEYGCNQLVVLRKRG